MDKINTVIPEKFQILGGKVVVSEQTFLDFIKALNSQSIKINELTEENNKLKQDVSKLTTDLQTIAKAVSILMED